MKKFLVYCEDDCYGETIDDATIIKADDAESAAEKFVEAHQGDGIDSMLVDDGEERTITVIDNETKEKCYVKVQLNISYDLYTAIVENKN
jgi:hypothetical protein